MLQLSTGAGKTILFSSIAREFTTKGEGVLVLAHREELLTQAQEKLESVTGMPVGIIKAGTSASPLFPIQVASVQSLVRRQHMPNAALVICDEAHHSCSQSYTKIFENYPDSYILGVTATPARNDGQGFKFLYDSLVLGLSTSELIEAGYLCKFKLFASPKQIKTTGVKTTAGEFNQRQLADAIDTSLVMGDLIETWKKHALGKKTVVFTIDVAHSKATAQAYIEAGIPAEHLDGETPTNERKSILERFRTGETLILTNCGIVSEGFDVPDIECVQCVRPTKSLPLWLQMVGRALRPAPGKEYAIIIDHTQNWFYHGLPDEEREWSLEPVSLESLKWALQCPECFHAFKPLPHEEKPYRQEWDAEQKRMKLIYKANCPNCGTLMEFERGTGGEPPAPRKIENNKKAQVEEINLEANQLILAELYRLKERQELYGYKPMWIYFRLIETFPNIGLIELKECAKLIGYKSGWAWFRWQELQQKLQQSA